ncbi:Lytic transglycosylase catalytic [Methylocella silvestris BL2]|uniref:Lytic transglycosylase catalytic n=1 Tax=Methylocella silvestris (strain DSM 15510 / CIP 108128 / LMG 27833 / NCIMB 13906 / BL2) TaxID=395965 RepID=B8EJT2_METSB|nr:Lytic transglycosylase catalytic [Methylocella silvestris BL2]
MAAGRIAFAIVLLCTSCGADDAVAAPDAAPAQTPTPLARPTDLGGGAPQQAQEPAGQASDGVAEERQKFRGLLRREAEKTGLPSDIADAVVSIESGYDPSVIGGVGEIGLMQVRPETAAMLGFRGDSAELAQPEVNIRYGVAYLAEAWRLAGGDLCRALMKYRAGHGEEQMSALSIIYCGRARAHLAAIGSPFAAGASVPMIADAAGPRLRTAMRRAPRIRTEAVSRAFWAAHEARIAAITRRIEAKWRKVASR